MECLTQHKLASMIYDKVELFFIFISLVWLILHVVMVSIQLFKPIW